MGGRRLTRTQRIVGFSVGIPLGIALGILVVLLLMELLSGERPTTSSLIKKADRAYEEGNIQQALQLYDEARDISPSNRYAQLRSVVLSIEQEDYEVALPKVEAALLLWPDDFLFHEKKGDILMALDRWDEAIGSYRESVRENPPGYWTPWLKLGAAQEMIGAGKQARQTYVELLEICPNMKEAQERLERLNSPHYSPPRSP